MYVRKNRKTIEKIYLKEILFIENMENYMVIHTPVFKNVATIRLKILLDSLPAELFMGGTPVFYCESFAYRGHRRESAGDRRA